MMQTHAVGIDLGTTYSCIACLNEHGAPESLANQEGELQTPSVVLFDEGACIIDDLPADLPVGSKIDVSLHYDAQARLHRRYC